MAVRYQQPSATQTIEPKKFEPKKDVTEILYDIKAERGLYRLIEVRVVNDVVISKKFLCEHDLLPMCIGKLEMKFRDKLR